MAPKYSIQMKDTTLLLYRIKNILYGPNMTHIGAQNQIPMSHGISGPFVFKKLPHVTDGWSGASVYQEETRKPCTLGK